MYLRVKEGVVVVTTPSFVSREEVNQFVDSNQAWIHRQMSKVSKPLQTGDTIHLLGQAYRVIEDRSFYISKGHLHIVHNEKQWRAFIQQIFHNDLENRFYRWADEMGYQDTSLKFGFYTSKWGSCRKDLREIRLNSYLVLCDWDQIDAIIVHELCHLKFSNHSRAFYQEVNRWKPDYALMYNSLKKVRIPKIE